MAGAVDRLMAAEHGNRSDAQVITQNRREVAVIPRACEGEGHLHGVGIRSGYEQVAVVVNTQIGRADPVFVDPLVHVHENIGRLGTVEVHISVSHIIVVVLRQKAHKGPLGLACQRHAHGPHVGVGRIQLF